MSLFNRNEASAFLLGGVTASLVYLLISRKKTSVSSLTGVSRMKPPNPNWKPGQKQPPPFNNGQTSKMIQIDPKKIKSSYPMMISAYVPRPIALISTLDKDGVGNVAPFSFSGVAGFDPPTIAVSVCRKRGENPLKDTHTNIAESGEFVVCIINEWFVNAANHTSMECVADENEMELSGLTPTPSHIVKPPRISESAMHFECKLIQSIDLKNAKGDVTTTMFLGEVVMFHVNDAVLDSQNPDYPSVKLENYHPVSRLGGNTFGLTTQVFDIPRPKPDPKN